MLEKILKLAKDNKGPLLAHHLPNEYYRTVKIGRNRFCARCLGIYAGFLLAAFAILLGLLPGQSIPIIVFLFPLIAVVDWSFYKLAGFRGTNAVRIISGFLMGFSYITMIWLLLQNWLDWRVFASAIGYGGWIVIVLALSKGDKTKQVLN